MKGSIIFLFLLAIVEIHCIVNILNEESTHMKDALESFIDKNTVLLFVYKDEFKHYLPKDFGNVVWLWNVDEGPSEIFENDRNCLYNNYVVLTNSDDLYDLLKTLRMSRFWMSGPKTRDDNYYLFVFDETNETETFERLWEMEMTNVLLFETIDSGKWNAFTYRPFAEESKCGNAIRPLAVANSIEFSFKEKHPYMKDCHLNMSYTDVALLKKYFYEPPYALLMPIHMLIERYELNYTYFSMPLDYQMDPVKGAIFVKEEIDENMYDGIVGIPIRQLEYPVVFDNILELSQTLGFDEFMWIVPKPRKIPNVRILLKVFPTSIYAMCISTTTFTILIWIYLSKLIGSNRYDVMGLLSVTLGYGMRVPDCKILKFIFILYLLYTSHVVYFFQGNFSSKLLIPQYEARIKDIEELIDSRIQMQLHEMQRELLFTAPDMPLAKRMYDKIFSAPPLGFDETIECGELMNKSKTDFAVRNSRTSSTYDQDCAEYMDVIYDYISPNLSFSYLLKSGHPLLGFLNRFIEIFKECGYVNKGYYGTALPSNYNKIQGNVSLTLEHFQASFLMLATGLTIGLCVFVAELLFYKNKNNRN